MVGNSQALPAGHTPLLLRAGVLACRTAAGALAAVLLDTHAPLKVPGLQQGRPPLTACTR